MKTTRALVTLASTTLGRARHTINNLVASLNAKISLAEDYRDEIRRSNVVAS
ncbi:MAG TPA: hypothetical protein VFR94_05380 [Nitrososphaeraceae archaeon]|nr:hypothetical protein [Nitrososphaeraceae archaeon]